MIGKIKIYQQEKLKGTNVYVFKFDKESLNILNTNKLEVKFNKENNITLFKPSLNTSSEYKIKSDSTIRVSTQDAYIDLTGDYYINFEEDDSVGYTLNKIK